MAENSFPRKLRITVLGTEYVDNADIEPDNIVRTIRSIAAAKTGTLTTRTDDNTGTLTMSASHGITDGNRLDVYWTASSVEYCRRGMTVGTVSVNSVPVDGGAGDVLPAAATSIRAMVPTSEAIALTGDNAICLIGFSDEPAAIVYADSSNNELAAFVVTGDGDSDMWDTSSGETNPLAGDTVAKIFLSHGYSSGTASVEAITMYN